MDHEPVGEEPMEKDDLTFGKKKRIPTVRNTMEEEQAPIDTTVIGADGEPPIDLREENGQCNPDMEDVQIDDDITEFIGDGTNEDQLSQSLIPLSTVLQSPLVYSELDYHYEELLTRMFDIMRAKNPGHFGGEKEKIVMRPPQVVRVGTKKTCFANFTEICCIMRRQPKHLIAFMLAELGTTGSVDANSQLIIKGRFLQKQIENVLRRYIKEYVTCHSCHSPETFMQKDDQTRVNFLQCETCGSRCSVTKVSSGYQAVTVKRAALRAREM